MKGSRFFERSRCFLEFISEHVARKEKKRSNFKWRDAGGMVFTILFGILGIPVMAYTLRLLSELIGDALQPLVARSSPALVFARGTACVEGRCATSNIPAIVLPRQAITYISAMKTNEWTRVRGK